nr:reverse transcriptase domain-containing protein [Tanacetum cinerariifolium]
MPRGCLKIIKSKSKVRQSRAKAVIAKIALLLDKKNQSPAPSPSTTPAPVKAVEPNCVTCGDTHSYQNCPATHENAYRDNIQEYVSQAAAASYNQGNTDFRPQMVANQIRPPGFPPYQNNQNNFNKGNNFNQNRGGNFNQSNLNPSSFNQGQLHGPQGQSTQNQCQNIQNQNQNWSGTLPGNTITNPKEDLKGITTQSGVAYQGPKTPSHSKQETKPSIPYPSRRDNEKRHDQANEQIKKFYEIFKDMSFKISFTDALTLMPKFASTLKALIRNKEKLNEMARTLMNEHYLGASINLMPFSVWEALSLLELTPTCMTLELADRSFSKPIGIAKDVSFKVGVFQFPADFVVVNFEPDPRVPLFLRRCFLKTGRALIDELKVCESKTVKSSVDESPEVELKDLPPHLEYAFLEGDNKFPVIIAKELGKILSYKAMQHQRRVNPKIHDVIKKEVEKLLDAGLIYPISDSPWVSPVHCVPKKGGFTVVENEENELILTRLVTGWQVCIDYRKLNEATQKDHFPFPFMDQMLERLAKNEYYCFLDGFFGYFQIPIDPHDQEKTTFTSPYGTFAYRRMPFGLCNALGTFQRCMLAIFHDMVEKTIDVFMDDFSVFGDSFKKCLSHLDKMLQRCEDTNLSLNWEKIHFMVKEG